jgi:hypothetical protein
VAEEDQLLLLAGTENELGERLTVMVSDLPLGHLMDTKTTALVTDIVVAVDEAVASARET